MVSRSIARYSPSRRYALFAVIALLGAAGTGLAASPRGFGYGAQYSGQLSWIVASVLFAFTSGFTLLLALRPPIEICDTHIEIGHHRIFWAEVQRVDRVAVGKGQPWTAPLLLRMKLSGGQEILVFHPGDVQSCLSLMRHIYRHSARGDSRRSDVQRSFGEKRTPSFQFTSGPFPASTACCEQTMRTKLSECSIA